MVGFEDETWTSLYPRVEAKWMKRGQQERVVTPGYNRRRNVFVTLFWPKKRGFVWNRFKKRRSREFKLHLSNLVQYAKRHGVKKVILFADHAPCHKTKNVRRFIREHPILKVKRRPKRAPKLNPTEWIVNRPLKSVVCSNRSYRSLDEVDRNTVQFLRQHRTNLRT
ncbi:MAG: transposase [Nitrososphaerota archaeon]|nr:transposase [Nitrososphaerota archaeon]